MRASGIAAIVAATLAIGCSSDSPLPTEPVIALSPLAGMVPFKTRHIGTAADPSGVSCPTGAVAAKNTVAGNGTHLGEFTGENTSCFAPDTPLTAHFVSGEGFFIAANGDRVTSTIVSGRIVITPVPGGSPILTITTENDITGGTGRFEGATGHFSTFSERDLFGPPALQTTADGVISSPGSIMRVSH